MDMIAGFTQGRHCTWWAEKSLETGAASMKQRIVRGFPSKGIPFPKVDESDMCDVCRTPKTVKRGSLPWMAYGGGRGEAAILDPRSRAKGKQKVEEFDCVLDAFPKLQKRNKLNEKEDGFVRHDGHFKKAERKRVVSYVKQYQRSGQSSAPVTGGMIDDHGADNDVKMPSVPTCGVDCYKIREDVYRAVDELMSKQPVVRIRPRIRPAELLDFHTLGPLPSVPTSVPIIEASSLATGSEVGNREGDLIPSRDALAVTLTEQKIEASTQTQTPPYFVTEAPTSDIAATVEHEAEVPDPELPAATPTVATLFIQAPTIPTPQTQQLPLDSHLQLESPQSRITTLLFPQPRIASPVDSSQFATTNEQSTEWNELPRDSVTLYREKNLVPSVIPSSLNPESMEQARERQRAKHWDRDRVSTAIFYREMMAKTSHDQVVMRRDPVRNNDEDKVGVEEIGDIAEGDVIPKDDRQPVEVRLKLSSILERLTLEVGNVSKAEDRTLQERGMTRGLQEVVKTAEEFELRNASDPQREQHVPVTRSISPTELECMKAAILNHNFYPRLVSSFVEQHAQGAPPETVTKLEEVRWRVMQSWNPSNSVECDEKIRKYQEILTKFESELEQPFREAMDISWRLENRNKSLPYAQTSKIDQGESSAKEEEKEEEAQTMFS
ncbi:hypothetical protein Mp_2g11140 [Marchantia polymorpha subsp. ruderalis]|uniref:KNOX1 domain-containing protein n=2 Tax=Marchantia polymorpha TaxID=3197 RepID=A0A2R6XCC5_MARPO|nr:hypothetical protein MARPO_0023s0081 [Marchantia polymorpha]BBN01898.1 hypothetical protein Mp_2g11140 [Marchantia polymorpha subsp. ruderalis]|eukprot:PTQ43764.1 hypothetical protein MARPO_0023s0081 [Marchantia polymorpha]